MDITLFTAKEAPTIFFSQSHDHRHRHRLHRVRFPNLAMQSSTSQSSEYSLDHSPPAAAGKWSSTLLNECARAISDKDSNKIHHLLWMLNELASPYGDSDQKLAYYFLQALFCRATETGLTCYKTLVTVSEKNYSFDSALKLILKFQEVSPWMTFGHVASNGAILEALERETKLHIIDISDTLCTQWPTLLESLATRNDDTPHLKLTVVSTTTKVKSLMKEIGQRMEKFARLMGVPFEFNPITNLNQLSDLENEALKVEEDEAIAINCNGALRTVKIEERNAVISMLKSLKPRVLTIVEEEADFISSKNKFLSCFDECLRFYTLYFEMLEESFEATSNEKLGLERECSRNIVRLLGCGNETELERELTSERREKGKQWSERLEERGFSSARFCDDVMDDVKALLKRYKPGWALMHRTGAIDTNRDEEEGGDDSSGIYLTWKEEPVVWISAWKP
ncbi:protein SHORT-ROOT-like [Cucurbita pepo subsp. pepo]|uniref:protein SHORT-ROOT-like n=1 Tax=Cucurbita pepo subsp. pepo TaxID=3664 RepID=UPI000C9D3FF2|nr:protein SHORT-ROOT-like [Cucurbita pepo subsp. pepo]